MDNTREDSHDYGERGQPAGLPDSASEQSACGFTMDDAQEIVRDLFGFDFPSAREQARRWVREAMEGMCSEGHVALALTPVECRPQPLSERELDELAIRQGDGGEARLHFFGRRPVNYHE